MLEEFARQLAASQTLTDEQVSVAVEQLVNESVPALAKADFLHQLALKGETVEEIGSFARALRAKAVEPPIEAAWRETHEILDVCGTGGDRLNTFNISTTVALICAAAGVPVAKHGNRAITSQAGSADVLEALGIRIDLSPGEAAASLRERNFAFFFAPNYHPTFKQIAPARKLCAERGQRTIFNFLGPLLNPARPTAQLVGVPRPELCEPMARVLQSLAVRRGMVVCGQVAPLRKFAPFEFDVTNRIEQIRVLDTHGRSQLLTISAALTLAQQERGTLVELAPHAHPPVCGLVSFSELERLANKEPDKQQCLDELSILGENLLAEFYQEKGFAVSKLSLEQFELQFASLADLLGGDREANAQIVRRLLEGEERGPKRDAILLNAGAALMIAGQARTLTEGWDAAADIIDSGQAQRKLEELKER